MAKNNNHKAVSYNKWGIYLPDTICSSISHIPARSAYQYNL